MTFTALWLALSLPALGGSSGEELRHEAEKALNNLNSADSALTNFFENSAGYAVFPSVRRSGVNLTGEPVRGIVYEKGKPVGEAALAEKDVGRQDSAGPFHEVIFFETAEALDNLKQGRFVKSADINPVAAAEGAALTAKYREGVIVFVIPKSGLMEAVSLGDQKFSYQPQEQRKER